VPLATVVTKAISLAWLVVVPWRLQIEAPALGQHLPTIVIGLHALTKHHLPLAVSCSPSAARLPVQ
jgi:hypothetical protein